MPREREREKPCRQLDISYAYYVRGKRRFRGLVREASGGAYIEQEAKRFGIELKGRDEAEVLDLITTCLDTKLYFLGEKHKYIKDRQALKLSESVPKEWREKQAAESKQQTGGLKRSFWLERERELGNLQADGLSDGELRIRAEGRILARVQQQMSDLLRQHVSRDLSTCDLATTIAFLSEYLEDPNEWIRERYIEAYASEYPDGDYIDKASAIRLQMKRAARKSRRSR